MWFSDYKKRPLGNLISLEGGGHSDWMVAGTSNKLSGGGSGLQDSAVIM